jgi:hypothetical protein
MTGLTLFLCILCQFFLIGGQLLLKRAISLRARVLSNAQRMVRSCMGVGCLSVWFFLWLGILQQLPLSRAFPFEGLNPALMAVEHSCFSRSGCR